MLLEARIRKPIVTLTDCCVRFANLFIPCNSSSRVVEHRNNAVWAEKVSLASKVGKLEANASKIRFQVRIIFCLRKKRNKANREQKRIQGHNSAIFLSAACCQACDTHNYIKTQNLKVNIIKINFASTPTKARISLGEARRGRHAASERERCEGWFVELMVWGGQTHGVRVLDADDSIVVRFMIDRRWLADRWGFKLSSHTVGKALVW